MNGLLLSVPRAAVTSEWSLHLTTRSSHLTPPRPGIVGGVGECKAIRVTTRLLCRCCALKKGLSQSCPTSSRKLLRGCCPDTWCVVKEPPNSNRSISLLCRHKQKSQKEKRKSRSTGRQVFLVSLLSKRLEERKRMANKAKQARLDLSVLGKGQQQQEPWVILALLQPARLFYQVKKDSITVGTSEAARFCDFLVFLSFLVFFFFFFFVIFIYWFFLCFGGLFL